MFSFETIEGRHKTTQGFRWREPTVHFHGPFKVIKNLGKKGGTQVLILDSQICLVDFFYLMVNEYHNMAIIHNRINVKQIHHPSSRSDFRKVRVPRNLRQVMPCGTYLFVGICWNSLKQIFGSVFVFNDSLVVNLLKENISPCPSDRWFCMSSRKSTVIR